MRFVILGCGRVGALVASELAREHEVAVVDWSQSAFDRLASDYSGETHVGNGIDIDVLRGAGADRADTFIALTDVDNRNLMAAQVAKHLGASKVIARVYDPVRSEAFESLGILSVSPTVAGAQRLFDLVAGSGEGE